MIKTVDTTALQSSLETLQQRITLLKEKKRDANAQKAKLEGEISKLYSRPLNARQALQLVQSVVDERANVYQNEVLSSGFVEAHKVRNGKPLSFDDYEGIHGRERVRGVSPQCESLLLYKLELVKTYGTSVHTWMPFLFSDVLKERLYDLHVKNFFRTKINAIQADGALSDAEKEAAINAMDEEALRQEFDGMESVEARGEAIHCLNEQVKKLEKEISSIDTEISEASGPINSFMRAVR